MPNIEDQIQKAIQEGQFENLTGKGQPLTLDENPFVEPEWRLAHHILKSSGFSLPWIETRNEVFTALKEARTSLANSWDYRVATIAQGLPLAQIEAEWQRDLTTFNLEVQEINKRIRSYNLGVPSSQLQIPVIDSEAEIAAIPNR